MNYKFVHKTINNLHVITSPDLPGLYVAHPEESVARGQVDEAVAAIEQINARAEERKQLQNRYA